MTVFLISFVVFVTAVVLMGLGVLLGRRAIQGSCGGLNHIPGVLPDCGGTCTGRCSREHNPSRE